jgi:hypothetical protein
VDLVRLLEAAAGRAGDDGTCARVLARLAYELLSDASAGPRRRQLADQALRLARRVGTHRLWPRCSTGACTRCGTRPVPPTGWPPRPRSWNSLGRRGTVPGSVAPSSGGSWR